MLISSARTVKVLFNISVLIAVCSVLLCCGGGGGGDDQNNLDPKTPLLGRWTGVVHSIPDQTCVVDNGVDLNNKTYTFDIFQSDTHVGLVATDQDGVLYDALDSSASSDSSYILSSLNQDTRFKELDGPTVIEVGPSDGTSGTFKLYVTYNRFCTSTFSGTFQRVSNTSSTSPSYAEITGTWDGSLAVVSDECSVGVNPLVESHRITTDETTVNLVSTDKRILQGHRSTLNSLLTEIYNFPNSDAVAYQNITDNTAEVTVTHFGGDSGCTTAWKGLMSRH